MLETAISKTRKMNVMEREQWGSVVQERALGQMGITKGGGTVKGLKGVDYNVYGTITKFGFRKSGFSLQGGSGIASLLPGNVGMALGSVGSSEVETEMAVDIKITDVSTGNIVIAETVESSVKQGGSFTIGDYMSSQPSFCTKEYRREDVMTEAATQARGSRKRDEKLAATTAPTQLAQWLVPGA